MRRRRCGPPVEPGSRERWRHSVQTAPRAGCSSRSHPTRRRSATAQPSATLDAASTYRAAAPRGTWRLRSTRRPRATRQPLRGTAVAQHRPSRSTACRAAPPVAQHRLSRSSVDRAAPPVLLSRIRRRRPSRSTADAVRARSALCGHNWPATRPAIRTCDRRTVVQEPRPKCQARAGLSSKSTAAAIRWGRRLPSAAVACGRDGSATARRRPRRSR